MSSVFRRHSTHNAVEVTVVHGECCSFPFHSSSVRPWAIDCWCCIGIEVGQRARSLAFTNQIYKFLHVSENHVFAYLDG